MRKSALIPNHPPFSLNFISSSKAHHSVCRRHQFHADDQNKPSALWVISFLEQLNYVELLKTDWKVELKLDITKCWKKHTKSYASVDWTWVTSRETTQHLGMLRMYLLREKCFPKKRGVTASRVHLYIRLPMVFSWSILWSSHAMLKGCLCLCRTCLLKWPQSLTLLKPQPQTGRSSASCHWP